MRNLILLSLLTFVAFTAPKSLSAGELDNDHAIANQGLQGSLIIRVDSQNGAVEYFNSNEIASTESEAAALAAVGKFEAATIENLRSELDNNAGSSSWYFYWGPRYYGHTYWHGHYYTPYYTWGWGHHRYYYYHPWFSWWRRW